MKKRKVDWDLTEKQYEFWESIGLSRNTIDSHLALLESLEEYGEFVKTTDKLIKQQEAINTRRKNEESN